MQRILVVVALAASSLANAQSNAVPGIAPPARVAAPEQNTTAPNTAAAASGPAPGTADVPCSKSAGAKKAEEYVQQCLEVSPATHPPCNASNSCDLIIDEIKRGCAMIQTNVPAFCAAYAAD
jgi:hypothetical protein